MESEDVELGIDEEGVVFDFDDVIVLEDVLEDVLLLLKASVIVGLSDTTNLPPGSVKTCVELVQSQPPNPKQQ